MIEYTIFKEIAHRYFEITDEQITDYYISCRRKLTTKSDVINYLLSIMIILDLFEE